MKDGIRKKITQINVSKMKLFPSSGEGMETRPLLDPSGKSNFIYWA
jgi:hypothetical protein